MADYQLNSGTFVSLADLVFAQWQAIFEVKSREVEICNLALANIGESARITSIDPPDGSAQALHCARFYPYARDTLLERHAWDFTTRQVKLVPTTNDRTDWDHAYEWVADATGILVLVPERLATEYWGRWREFSTREQWNGAAETPYVYTVATNQLGARVIYSNTADAVVIYSSSMHDATHFSTLFVQTLSYELASRLAGPIIKGDRGIAIMKEMLQLARVFEESARKQDSSKRRKPEPNDRYPWARR